MMFRRSILALFAVCLGCTAQSAPPDVAQRMERQVRAYYNVPATVRITFGPLKPSEFPNYDTVTVTMQEGDKKREYDFLLSRDGKTLLRTVKLDLSKDPYVENMKKIDLKGRPTRGNKGAKVVVVNYDDFQCPFCSRMHQTLFPEVLKEYGDKVMFVYKDYPLSEIHPWARHAAVNANCLEAQSNEAFWDFADYLHAHANDINAEKRGDPQTSALDNLAVTQGQNHSLDMAKLQACVKAQAQDAINASISEADTVGVSATPTLFVNGQRVDGAVPPSELRAILDRALEQAGEKPPVHTATSEPGPAAPGK